MDFNVVPPPGGWGALAILGSGIASAVITQIGIIIRARRRDNRGLDRANLTAADKANERLASFFDRRLNELRQELHDARDELRETRVLLEEKNEEWMIASKAHEDCQRRLVNVERRLRELDGKDPDE